MKITPEMKVKEVLEVNEKMLEAFTWLAPEFERLRNDKLRRAMSGRITVSQAAKIAKIPLTEALYLLNLSAGEDEEKLSKELMLRQKADFEYIEVNSIVKPSKLLGVQDTDLRVIFLDVTEDAANQKDPMPKIAKGLVSLKNKSDILLIRHPFDPIPLRELFARRHNLESWAEERLPNDWYIYFFHPEAMAAAAVAHPSLTHISNKTEM